jgi:hypothetical protein
LDAIFIKELQGYYILSGASTPSILNPFFKTILTAVTSASRASDKFVSTPSTL